MDIVGGIALNIGASVLSAILGFFGAKMYAELRKQRPLEHVLMLLGNSKRIIVVFPANQADDGETSGNPRNAIRMSLAEGAAIARIGQLCRDARPGTEMHLVHPDDLLPNKGPFVLIGDVAGSAWANQWVANNFPRFSFTPASRRVEYDGAHWETQVVDGMIRRDFGFILVGRTETHQRFVILFGASVLGTNIAVRVYSDLRPQLSRERYKGVLEGKSFLLVARGDVDGYGVRTDDVDNVQVVGAYVGNR